MDSATTRTFFIDGQEITLKATARTPRLYRATFGRDMLIDMQKLQKAYLEAENENVNLSAVDLTLFENLAFIMAKHADPGIPDNPDDWLDSFSMFSIYEIMPKMFDLWQASTATTATPKKK